MRLALPMLASGGLGSAGMALVPALVVCWGLSALLAVANLLLIVFLKLPRRTRVAHVLVFLFPLIGTGLFFVEGFKQSLFRLACEAFGVPLLVMAQFGHLLVMYRRLRPQRARSTTQPAQVERGPRCVRCQTPIELGTRICPKCGWTQPVSEGQ